MTDDKNKGDFHVKDTETKGNKSYWVVIIGAIIGLDLIALAIFSTPTIVTYCIGTLGWELVNQKSLGHGEFGDMFGMTNAVFSGLAFLGVICAIILQSQELAAQREELRLTRKEFKQQNKTASEQHKTMELQRFENTFFHLLDGLKREKTTLPAPCRKVKKRYKGMSVWRAYGRLCEITSR